MDLKMLKTFLTIVRLGGFQKTAEELQYAQSTISMQIQKLEADLGVTLFVRDGKRIRLTEAGRMLSRQAEPLLKSAESLREALAGVGQGMAGQVRIASVEPAATSRLSPVLADFSKERPAVKLSLEIGNTDFVCGRVASGHADFGLCSPVSSGGLRYEPLFQETFSLLVAMENPLSQEPALSSDSLHGQRLLLKERTCHYRAMMEISLAEKACMTENAIEVGSFEAIKQLVQRNLGIAFIPDILLKHIPDGTVVRQVSDLDLKLTIGLVYREEAYSPQAAEILMENIRQSLLSS
ncbi:LysR family transcriptional regulator [Paenibacillus sp. P26]|nr:LysR family transcriptional regulator [Paenibacillus sp. P26]